MKITSKKFLCLLLALMMVLSIAACDNGSIETPTDTDAATNADAESTEGTSEESTEDTTEEETTRGIIEAGSDTDVVRDGTPKKYFTISVDGGIDEQLISVLNKYGINCVTFNIDPAALSENGLDAYAGFDLAIQNIDKAAYDVVVKEVEDTLVANGVNLNKLKDSDKTKVVRTSLKAKITPDIEGIANATFVRPVGMAFAGGSEFAYYQVINDVFATGTVKYTRGYKESENFELPKYFMHWMPTCFIDNDSLIDIANEFANSTYNNDKLFMLALDSSKMEGNYEKLEQLISIITAKEEIVLVNNSEFYQLFKEEIPSWEETAIVAGTDTTIVRDGTPKKYFTLSFDDGITQDLRIIEILKKYNAYCATFNINTGLYGANWEWVGQTALQNPSVTHIRFTKEELMTGIYDGFEVAVHTLNHPSLKNYDNSSAQIKKEVQNDANNICSITGVMPIGMAWPGGDTEYTRTTIEKVMELTSIRYARGTTRTGDFSLPTEFLQWMPTCSLSDSDCLRLADKFVKAECKEDMLFYVWCHGYEFDHFQTWDRLEKLVKMMAEDDSIVLVTNAEFYELFKDQIPSIIVAE